jgi:Bacterial self-protective colicin-like immunity
MNKVQQLLEEFVVGRFDAATFQTRYLAIWRDMRDKGEPWPGEAGKVLAALFSPSECFDPDLTPEEPTSPFALNEAQFRAEVLELHRKLHAIQQAA